MRPLATIWSTETFFLALVGFIEVVSSTSTNDTSPGSITIFSDNSCTDQVISTSGSVPLDACIPASTSGDLSTTFIVSQKPFCQDGHRPDLVLFEDPCCGGNAIANYIPNANYGDYGDGSCQHLIGGGFRALVFVCGKFQVPTPSVIAASFTFPGSPSETSSTIPHQCLAKAPSTTPASQSTSLPGTTTATTPAISQTSSSSLAKFKPAAAAVGLTTLIILLVVGGY
ncbi:hypothetical protein GQ53DRAFT_357941 [Thozetella sp. PMI_491]|nr:hypothetical protein GQ53DRAFT_357941 [Thozetella sp. PMI_491]